MKDLEGETILITAGPTQEPLDPVRYLSNRSSGKMGYALAQAAIDRGARVILISGPVSLNPPAGAEVIHVRTAAEMRDAVFANLEPATVVIKCAAVADFRPSVGIETEDQEDLRPHLARTRPHAGHPGRTRDAWESARRPFADRLCRRNGESRARSAPQAGNQELRYGRGESCRDRPRPGLNRI